MFVRDGDDKLQRNRFSRRALTVGIAQLAGPGLLAGRLYQLQVMERGRYALLADDNRIAMQSLAPERGRILDRAGAVLADNVEGLRVSVVPALAGDLARLLAQMARIIPLPTEEQERLLARAKRQPRTQPLVIASGLTFEQAAAVNLNAPNLPGVETDFAYRRRYHRGAETGLVVGFVGAVEHLAIDDDPVIRLPGMRLGKSGVERALETHLRGEGGHVKQEIDAKGRIVRTLERVEPIRGNDVVVTVDAALQAEVTNRLKQERRGAVVALDIATGEVVAMASAPMHAQAELGVYDWRRLQSGGEDPLLNRAIQGLYPPGSTFKIVTALAALDAGIVTLKERIDCEGDYRYADQTYRCWKRRGHGRCDLHRALKESCDCYFYEIARRTGIVALAAMARKLGLGQIYPCGLALQKAGLIPTPDWKRARFSKPWHGGETLHAGIGQGFVLATPLQLAVMTARLAAGRNVTPLVARPADAPQPAAAEPLTIDPQWLETVRRGLFAVVNEDGGTGHNAQLADNDRVKIAGKTGTSQVNRASSDRSSGDLKWEERDHALFVGYAPSDRPRYAVAAVVEHGGGGGAAAAPLFRDVMGLLLKRDPAARPLWRIEGQASAPRRKLGRG